MSQTYSKTQQEGGPEWNFVCLHFVYATGGGTLKSVHGGRIWSILPLNSTSLAYYTSAALIAIHSQAHALFLLPPNNRRHKSVNLTLRLKATV